MAQARQNKELNTNINILHAMMRPGQSLGTTAIAEICGVHNNAICEIQKIALRKVREAFRKKYGLSHGQMAVMKLEDL